MGETRNFRGFFISGVIQPGFSTEFPPDPEKAGTEINRVMAAEPSS